jgi:hypothetical protein
MMANNPEYNKRKNARKYERYKAKLASDPDYKELYNARKNAHNREKRIAKRIQKELIRDDLEMLNAASKRQRPARLKSGWDKTPDYIRMCNDMRAALQEDRLKK